MNDTISRSALIAKLREVASLTPPICANDRPKEVDIFGKKITVYCKPFEDVQTLCALAADVIEEACV